MMEIQRVHFHSPTGLQWLPEALARVREFAKSTASDADVSTLIGTVASDMYASSNHMLLVAIVGEEDKQEVVGHLLANLQSFYGPTSVHVSQLHHDPGVQFADEIYRAGMEMVEDWAREMGAVRVTNWALNDRVANIFERRAGFRRDGKVLMRKDVQVAGGE